MSPHASGCSTCGMAHDTISSDSKLEESFYSNILVAPGTRHHGLLTSNETPLESDLPAVKSMISKVDACLVCLDTEISGLQDQVQQLEEELAGLSSSDSRNDIVLSQTRLLRDRLQRLEQLRAMLSSLRAQNTSILSPLRRMPPEVLGEIFSWTLPSIDDVLERGFDVIGNSPWVLGHISSHWRAVALSIPSLWSFVAINYSVSSWYPLSMLETQLRRARNLKIHFSGREIFDSRPQIAVFQCLAEHSFFWEELSITLTSHLWPILSTFYDRLPLLARLLVEWDDPDLSAAGAGSIDCFQTAPRLVDVSTETGTIPVLLPTHQLTRYEFVGPWGTQASLNLAENLVEAYFVIDFDSIPEPIDIISLLRLQRLYISEPRTLKYLKTPVLREIACYIENDEADYLPHLDPFLVRSGCDLRRFCFRGLPDARKVSEILRKYPSIIELAIMIHNHLGEDLDAVYDAASTLISQLIIPNPTGSAAVSPQLTAIDFGCEEETYIDYALFLKMLESRWRAENCALKSAALVTDSGPWPNSATFDRLRSLGKDGLDLLLLDDLEGGEAMDGWSYASMWT
ncbi:hypothetical protein FB451DRAFT_1234485 [Mycena latifolia]|nr:hypothetical protein FB451DRAFT_1234485 [Mycena latifolia]